MKVIYRRTGGFAPMPVGTTIDTDDCPADIAARLKMLIAASDIMNTQSAQIKGARDVRSHHLEIEDSGVTKRLTFDELSVPEKVSSLIQFLESQAVSLLPD